MVGPPRRMDTTMSLHPARHTLPRAQLLAERTFSALGRFLHIEAVSGVVLLVMAVAALWWANSPFAASYEALWHMPVSFGVGELVFSQSLHFWINDGLMTIFFLVVGMEIRREIHEGALSNVRQAALPIAAAVGGVAVPALIYLAFNAQAGAPQGWAVPTATDIAFAVGVLAILGRSIPSNLRIFLLTVAIIDDVIAVLIIAFVYSGGLNYSGFAVAGVGLLMVLGLQRIGIWTAYAYVIPGAVLWSGLLMTGAHPTLAGVVLGLMTPVVSVPMRERPVEMLTRIARDIAQGGQAGQRAAGTDWPLRDLKVAHRELLPPVVRVQQALHPFVAYGVMPLFALANAGVSLKGLALSTDSASAVMMGVAAALVLGKPLGVLAASWLAVKAGWCRLPQGVSWAGIGLVGLLAGIGFTMSIFIAMLAFSDPALLSAAKIGVLAGSAVSAGLGLAWGAAYLASERGARPRGANA